MKVSGIFPIYCPIITRSLRDRLKEDSSKGAIMSNKGRNKKISSFQEILEDMKTRYYLDK